MRKSYISFLIAFILLSAAAIGDADTVILKSGEMFQTRKAWKEDGIVLFYRNGKVVRVGEDDVERLIQKHITKNDTTSTKAPASKKNASPLKGGVDLPLPGAMGSTPGAVGKTTGGDIGYLDLKWNLSPAEIDGLTAVGTDSAYGGVKQFSKKQRSPRFGRARVEDIVYGFWQGGLYTITVWTGNFLDFRELKAEAIRRFGPAIQNRKDVEKYIWTDRHTDRMLAYDFDTDVGYLWMRSKAVHRKVKGRYPD